jgi:hypothetical protein
MLYVVEMAAGGMIHVPSFMTVGSVIRVILRLVPQQLESLQCFYVYYLREGIVKCPVEMASGGMLVHTMFDKDRFRLSKVVRGDTHTYEVHTYIHTHTQQGVSYKPCFYFWK